MKTLENADLIWKFNRLKLVNGYVNVTVLRPPFSLLSYFAFYSFALAKVLVNMFFRCHAKLETSQIKDDGRLFILKSVFRFLI